VVSPGPKVSRALASARAALLLCITVHWCPVEI
jgi:hypothetical protein